MDINATYDLSDDNYTLVSLTNTVTNLTQNYVLGEQVLETGFSAAFDVTAYSSNKSLSATVKAGGNGKIELKFDNPVVGKGVTYDIKVSYKTTEALIKNGLTKEIYIPKVFGSTGISKYTVSIIFPHSLGSPQFISPKPTSYNDGKINNTIRFSESQIFTNGITVFFGDYQIYNFELFYDLANQDVFKRDFSIPIPPNIKDRQLVAISDIQPTPREIYKDEDGNYFAKIQLASKESLSVRVSGLVKVIAVRADMAKSGKVDAVPSDIKKTYTVARPLWESNDLKIKQIGADLFNPNLSVAQNAEKVYLFVKDTLDYNHDKTRETRLGAVKALQNPTISVCMEYSDLTIAILRSIGIPAREIEGYAYSEDIAKKPLSVFYNEETDFLHSWVEFYDPVLGWIPFDPTWGDTSGLDYFNNMDTNHISFIIKGHDSAGPLPPGSFRSTGSNAKQINISFGSVEAWYTAKDLESMVTGITQNRFEDIILRDPLEIFLVLLLCGSFGFLLFHLVVRSK